MDNLDEIRYREAQKRVKKIKGFYTHLIVFIVINTMIIVVNYQELPKTEGLQWQHFSTLLFWGIGLLAHAFSVFMPHFLWGKNWEERKIQQFMDREKNNHWQ